LSGRLKKKKKKKKKVDEKKGIRVRVYINEQ